MALKSGRQTLRSYLKLTGKYTCKPQTKLSDAMDHGEKCMKVRRPLVQHDLRNRLLLCSGLCKRNTKQPHFSYMEATIIRKNACKGTGYIVCKFLC